MKELLKGYVSAQEKEEVARELFEEKVAKLDEKIEMREKQISRLEKKKGKLVYEHNSLPYSNWIVLIVEPLMKVLEEMTGLVAEEFGPFGLRSSTTIYLKESSDKKITEQKTLSLTLTPPLEDGRIFYDTGKKKEGYNEESKDVHGFWNEQELVPDTVSEILDLMKKMAI